MAGGLVMSGNGFLTQTTTVRTLFTAIALTASLSVSASLVVSNLQKSEEIATLKEHASSEVQSIKEAYREEEFNDLKALLSRIEDVMQTFSDAQTGIQRDIVTMKEDIKALKAEGRNTEPP